jgi:carbon monoxide dehydrogenase subunit G
MGTWSTSTTVAAEPREVLDVLTDPRACERWSPVPFELEGAPERLAAGTRTRVGGRIAGRRVEFDVEISHADDESLALRAQGPVEIEAGYETAPEGPATRVDAWVSVRSRGGLVSRVLAGAADGLLAAGALDGALGRIADELAPAPLAMAA